MFYAALTILAVVVVTAALLWRLSTPPYVDEGPRYRSRVDLFTGPERRFYASLRAAVADDFLVVPRVQIADLVEPLHGEGGLAREQIAGKYVDYVLVTPADGVIRLVVAVGDRSHHGARDAFAENLLHWAGIPLLRVESKDTPAEELHALIASRIELQAQAAAARAAEPVLAGTG